MEMPKLSGKELIARAREQLVPDTRLQVFEVALTLQQNEALLEGAVHDTNLANQLNSFIASETGLPVISRLTVLLEPSGAARKHGIVNLSVANIHAAPSHTSVIETQALMGTPVTVLRAENEWSFVQLPDHYLGWIDETLVRPSSQEFESWEAMPKLIVTTECSFSRRSPDTGTEVVSDIVAGDIFALLNHSDGWFEIAYPDARVAYVKSSDGEPYASWVKRRQATPDSIIATAKRFLGVPYLWGGVSPKALDCSGLVKLVFFLNGILLPRDADQQAACGLPVSLENDMAALIPGDLLFFGTKATETQPGCTGHVGISLGGKRFIQASGDVHIRSLNPHDSNFGPRWAASLLMARRIIGAGAENGIRFLTQEILST